MLLKRKALTTGFFDTAKGKDDAKSTAARGLVFGIGLQTVVDNDGQSRQRRNSQASEASLNDGVIVSREHSLILSHF